MAFVFTQSDAYNSPDYVDSGVQAPEVGSQYQSLINANPYRNAQYKVSPWQKFLSWLGFRTQADAWKENMSVQAQEYDASILQKAYNEDYDDPTSQVARMKAAGLNPDIDPSSINSGESSPMPEDPSTPMQSTGVEQQFGSFMTGVFDAFESCIGITSGIQGIIGKNIQNRMLNAESESQFVENAVGISDMFLPRTANPQGIQNWDWRSEASSNMDKYIDKHYRKEKDRQKFKDVVNQYWDSAIGSSATFEQMIEYMKSRKGYFEENQTNWSDLDDIQFAITEPIAQRAEKIIELRQQLEIEQSKYQKDLAANLNPELQAEAENTTAEYQSQFNQSLDPFTQAGSQNAVAGASAIQSQLNNELSEIQKEVIHNLVERSKKKGLRGWYARWILQRSMLRRSGGVDQFQDLINGVQSIPGL